MKTLEQLDKEYAQKRKDLEGEHRVAAALPVPPYTVNFGSKRNPWVSYEVKTLKEAVALADLFPDKLAYVSATSIYRHIQPEDLIEERYREVANYSAEEIADGTPYIDATTAEGYRKFEMVFFVRMGEQILKVAIRIDQPPHQWVPYCVFNPNDNVRRTPLRKHYPTVPGATCVHWGTGAGNAIHASYIWGCDGDFRSALTTLPEF
jgi:hypothetical protein